MQHYPRNQYELNLSPPKTVVGRVLLRLQVTVGNEANRAVPISFFHEPVPNIFVPGSLGDNFSPRIAPRKIGPSPLESPDIPITGCGESCASKPEENGSNRHASSSITIEFDAARSYCTFAISKTTAAIAGGLPKNLRRTLQA